MPWNNPCACADAGKNFDPFFRLRCSRQLKSREQIQLFGLRVRLLASNMQQILAGMAASELLRMLERLLADCYKQLPEAE